MEEIPCNGRTRKWSDVPIKTGTREHLGALMRDFAVSSFEEQAVLPMTLLFCMVKKANRNFGKNYMRTKN